MPESVTTFGELLGGLLISAAGFIVHPALGLAVSGTFLSVFSWLAAR